LWRQDAPVRVVVGVVDTGVEAPQLARRLVTGWNLLAADGRTRDDNGHGTMVAGIVLDTCRSCVVMPVKVLDATGHGPGAAIAAGIDWAVAHGAQVVNLSLVLDIRDPQVDSAVARALAAGAVVVAAAGNTGGVAPTYPAADAGVVSVSAGAPDGSLYPWSNGGEWVTTSAPGCNRTIGLTGPVEFCGTSAAAAVTSGVLGALLARGASSVALRAALAGGRPLPGRGTLTR
jgi:subtilisin family serine protease